jgi:RNA recognition motif-containing protein
MPKLFVGNLPFQATEDELRNWIEARGQQIEELRLMTDRETGKPRGFGFVTIQGDLDSAVAALNGQDFMGRALTVNEAKPMERRNGGGGGGGRGFDRGSRREPRW